jgi:hypothetical protein
MLQVSINCQRFKAKGQRFEGKGQRKKDKGQRPSISDFGLRIAELKGKKLKAPGVR